MNLEIGGSMNKQELLAKFDAKLKRENIKLKTWIADFLEPLGVGYNYYSQMKGGFAMLREDVEKIIRDFVND